MSGRDVGNTLGDEDDFTYTEDAAGQQKKVPVETEFIFKVVVLGDYSVGKTSLIKRLLAIKSLSKTNGHGKHNKGRRGGSDDDMNSSDDDDDDDVGMAAVTPTVGTDFYSMSLPHVLPGATVRLQLWDTAGLEKYAAKYENTFRNVSFVMCVFDVTSASSLHNVVDRHLSIAAEFIPDLDQSNIMVVANKIDIIEDLENTTTALRDARKRAAAPETAFAETQDDDTATNTDYFTSASGVDKDAIVTAKNVQAEVFDLFGEVHYAEVSAKTREHVRDLLETVAFALLRNSAEASGVVSVPETASTYDVFARTVLPMQTPQSSLTHGRPGARPASPPSAKPPLQPSTPPPSKSLPLAEQKEDWEENAPLATPTKPSASGWSTTGAFKFDMAPMQLSGTGVFSPTEGMEEAAETPYESPNQGDIPSAGASTVAGRASVSNSRVSLLKPEGVLVEVADNDNSNNKNGKSSPRPTARAPPDPNETPQQRKAREKAEMSALLSRAGQRNTATAGAAGDANSTQDELRNDADRMEDDVAAGRDQRSANHNGRGGVTPSILDTLGMQEEERKQKRGGGAVDEDDDHDDDGAQMQARLKDRFAQIEHDVRQDHAVARERAKKAKKAAKAKGTCKVCTCM